MLFGQHGNDNISHVRFSTLASLFGLFLANWIFRGFIQYEATWPSFVDATLEACTVNWSAENRVGSPPLTCQWTCPQTEGLKCVLAKNQPQAKLTRTVPGDQVGQNRVTCRIRHKSKNITITQQECLWTAVFRECLIAWNLTILVAYIRFYGWRTRQPAKCLSKIWKCNICVWRLWAWAEEWGL